MKLSSKVASSVLAAAFVSAPAWADAGFITDYSTPTGVNAPQVLVGQDGGFYTPYFVGTLGSAPTGTWANPGAFAAGVQTRNSVEVNLGASFTDFITFKVAGSPNQSSTKTTAFNISFLTFASYFSSLSVGLFQSSSPNFNVNMPGCNSCSGPGYLQPLAVTTFNQSQLGQTGGPVQQVSQTFASTLAPGDYFVYVSGVAVNQNLASSYNVAITSQPVPEPGTYAMLLAGLAAIGFVAKRRSAL